MKIIKIILKVLVGMFLVMVLGLWIWSFTGYSALEEMYLELKEIDTEEVTIEEDFDEISFKVENPKKNIVFIPGGLVEPDAYSYLAFLIAAEGYDVTISKTVFQLAILTPNYSSRFLSDELENVVIGHSLGGVTGSIMASGREEVDQVIFLGAYPIQDLSDKEVLYISAEYDDGMDEESLVDSYKFTDSMKRVHLSEGNHAQFGWYGPQRGDGEATISTLEQHSQTVEAILEFID